MGTTVFFSWQADTPTRDGRNFVERALQDAVKRIATETSIESAIRDLSVDRDTKDVSGFPPIVDTIFRKIDAAAIFVPDLTFVGKRLDGRPTPNPNVLIEYGWALKSLKHARIVPLMNTAFGVPTSESMPFDMAHLRRPICYDCPPDAEENVRKREREGLTRNLEKAIRAVIDSDAFKEILPAAPPMPPFSPRSPVDGRGRFRARNEPIGVSTDRFPGAAQEVKLSTAPVVWFRMMPTVDPGRTWTPAELHNAATQQFFLEPVSSGWRGYNFLRTHEGAGIYAFLDNPAVAHAVVFAFTNGEVWSIDTYWLDAMKRDGRNSVPDLEADFRRVTTEYAEFLSRLNIMPPYKWVAGMEDLRGRGLFVPARAGHISTFPGPHGSCQLQVAEAEGVYSPGDSPGKSLKPFFTMLFDSCGVQRPAWLDD